MAYWLFCQSCKEWTKSATPLSDDKSCAFCNNNFIKIKPLINPSLDNSTVENILEIDNAASTPETDDLTEQVEETTSFESTEEIIKQETSEATEPSIEIDVLPEPKIKEPSKNLEETESIEVRESPEVAEEQINEEISDKLETEEPESPEEPTIKELSETPETDEAIEVSTSTTKLEEPNIPTEERSTPAHRLFIEERRKNRKQR